MGALEKTKEAIRCFLPPHMMSPNEANPNKMSDKDFDLLCDNLDRTGMTDPILLRPMDRDATEKVWVKCGEDPDSFAKAALSKSLHFRIVGGHHRHKGAVFLDFDVVPVVIIMAEDFDDDQENFQLLRMNMISGKLDPAMFIDLYNKMSETYSDEILQEGFGFSDEREFQKLITQFAKTLPDKASQDKFKKQVAAQEIKTIDGLTKILNEQFAKFGDTIPFGYMVFDHGGQRSMWLRIEGKTMKALDLIGARCIEEQRTIDDIVGAALQLIAQGTPPDNMETLVKKTGMIKIPKKITVAPTKDNLDALKEIA